MNANTPIATLKRPLRPNTFECIRHSSRVMMCCCWCIVCHYKYMWPPLSGFWQVKDCSYNSSLVTWQVWLHGECQSLSLLQLFWWWKSVWLHACVFLYIIPKSSRQVWRAPVHIDSWLGCLFYGLSLSTVTHLLFLITLPCIFIIKWP